MKPVVFGSVGLGGYAWSVCNTLIGESERAAAVGDGDGDVRMHAVCEPEPARHAERVAEVQRRGIKVLQRYDDLLAEPAVEAVWLPLPIHLHRSFTERALRAGKAVICEKPAAGCVDDVDAMIAAQRESGLPVAIGYQDIYHPATLALKRWILDGRIGRPIGATLHACWPRGDEYYNRNAWAGALRREGAWVLDSPANNAQAHYLNLALFLLGNSEADAAEPVSVEAELYRARPIENFDTVSMRIRLMPDERPLVVLLTHACARTVHPRITIRGTSGTLDIRLFDRAEVRSSAGDVIETIPLRNDNGGVQVARSFARWMRGEAIDGAIATLAVSRPHAVVVSGASEASPVHDVPAEFVDHAAAADGHENGPAVNAIRGIEEIFERCAADNRLLSESPMAPPWAKGAGRKDLRGYRHFAGPRASHI
jgi:predicted dehydrogenase